MNRRVVRVRRLVLTLSFLGTLTWLAVPRQVRADAAGLELPTGVVVADILYTPGADTTFAITLEGIGEGFDVSDGTYDGWCVENNGAPNHFQVLLYSSYDPEMPSEVAFYQSDDIPLVEDGAVSLGDPVPWDRINYMVNHKQGGREDVQAAIWELIWGDASTLELTPAALAMLEAAGTFGDGYVPGEGDIMAVILYVDGLHLEGYQETVIEVPVPETATGAIGDRVWEDSDEDGVQDDGEPGVPGAVASLMAAGPDGTCNTGDEAGLAVAVTSADGYYLFENLPAGTYCIQFSPLPGTQFTLPDQGDDDTLDSDAAPGTGATGAIILAAGEMRLDIDAGLIPEPCVDDDGTTTLILAYRDAEGAISTVRSDTGHTEPLEAGGSTVTTGLSGTTTAAVNPLDGLVYLATGEGDDRLRALNPATGDVLEIGPLTGGASNLQAMDFAPPQALAHGFMPGALYGISVDGMEGCGPNCLFQIDAATGEATPLASLAANQIRGASFDPITGELWVYDPGGKVLSTVLPDGTMTERMTVPDSHQDAHTGVDTVFSLAHGCDGTLYAIDIAYGVLVRIDLEAHQAYWVAEYGSAASAFGSFEGNALDALDPQWCLCDPGVTPPPDSGTGGTTYTQIETGDSRARSTGCNASGSAPSGTLAWLSLVLFAAVPAVRRRSG